MQKSVFIILLIFFCGYGINAYAQNKIYWFSDRAQVSTQLDQDPRIPISVITDTTRLLMKSLPQYQFNSAFAQSPSIARLLKKLPNSCAPNRVKTPKRLKDNIYSLPINISLGLRLYFKQTARNQVFSQDIFDDDQQLISLASLFTGKSTYTLGVDEGRSFGIFLDNQITALDRHNLVIRRGGDATTSLVKMLLKNRIDYMIEYPVSVNEALNDNPTDIKLDSLRIASSPDYIIGYVACHKGPVGQKVIEDMNKALEVLYRSYSFYRAHTRYFEKTDIINFNRAYQATFKVAIPLKNEH